MRGDLKLGIAGPLIRRPRAGTSAASRSPDPRRRPRGRPSSARRHRPRPGSSPAPRISSASRFHHSPKTRSGPSARFTRRRMPRQVKTTGGWSGSSAMVVDRLGLGQQPGRPRPVVRPAPSRSGAMRRNPPDRALGHVAGAGGDPIELPVRRAGWPERVDQVARRPAAPVLGQVDGLPASRPGLGRPRPPAPSARCRSRDRWSRSCRRAAGDMRLGSRTGWAVPTRTASMRLSTRWNRAGRAAARRGRCSSSAAHRAVDQLAGVAGDRLGRADRLGAKARRTCDQFRRLDRLDRLGRAAVGLIQPADEFGTEAHARAARARWLQARRPRRSRACERPSTIIGPAGASAPTGSWRWRGRCRPPSTTTMGLAT